MSLERLQLDPFLLAQMYHQPIIPEEITAVPAEAKPLPDFKYLGENQKNILLLIQNESEAYLNEELFNLLANILNACKLGMQEVALLNVAGYPGLTLHDYHTALGSGSASYSTYRPHSWAWRRWNPTGSKPTSGHRSCIRTTCNKLQQTRH